jgi:hypothetical protein
MVTCCPLATGSTATGERVCDQLTAQPSTPTQAEFAPLVSRGMSGASRCRVDGKYGWRVLLLGVSGNDRCDRKVEGKTYA